MSRDPLTIEDHFPMSMLTRGGAIKTKGQRNAVRSPSGIDLWDHPMGSPFHRLPHSQLQRGRVHREREPQQRAELGWVLLDWDRGVVWGV